MNTQYTQHFETTCDSEVLLGNIWEAIKPDKGTIWSDQTAFFPRGESGDSRLYVTVKVPGEGADQWRHARFETVNPRSFKFVGETKGASKEDFLSHIFGPVMDKFEEVFPGGLGAISKADK